MLTPPSLTDRTRACLMIDLAALVANYHTIAQTAAPATVAAMVKADGYGLGVAPVADALWQAGCQRFYVAHMEGGVGLRALLPDAEILVLHGVMRGQEGDFIRHRLIPVLNSLEQLAVWREASSRAQPLAAMLHVDTGMERLGFSLRELSVLTAEAFGSLRITALMSHLACADQPTHALNAKQREALLVASRLFPHLPLSLSNSAGVFLGEGFHVQEVRPGSALYGLCAPYVQPCPLKPVVALYAPVLQWRTIDSAGTVGYGATHSVASGSRIAVLPVGYADGYPRSLGNRAHVAVHCRDGVVREAPVVGRVSMDLICVDVSSIAAEHLGDETVMELIGPNMPLNRLATEAETLNLELLTRLSGRYARVILPVTEKAAHAACA